MSFPIQPENNRLIVKSIKMPPQVLIGHIWTVEVANLSFAEVLAASKDSNYKVGTIVGHPTLSGLGQFINGEPCLWLRADEIWGVWEKSDFEKVISGNE